MKTIQGVLAEILEAHADEKQRVADDNAQSQQHSEKWARSAAGLREAADALRELPDDDGRIVNLAASGWRPEMGGPDTSYRLTDPNEDLDDFLTRLIISAVVNALVAQLEGDAA